MDVADADTYDIRFGAEDVRQNASKGVFLGGLLANQHQQVRVRGVSAADGAGTWSDPATIATRPDKPGPPFLQSPADRRHDRLILTWNEVNGIAIYDLQVNGIEFAAIVQRPYTFDHLPDNTPARPNVGYVVAIRARDDAVGGVSEWSDNSAPLVTRPPHPASPSRAPYDLTGWGIVLKWSLTDAFNGGTSAFIRLFRDMDSETNKKLLDGQFDSNGQPIPGGLKESRFVDSKQRMSAVKTYRMQLIVPPAATPAPIPDEDGTNPTGENRSFPSPDLALRYPFYLRALRPQIGRVVNPQRQAQGTHTT
ncbi:hypothetical protein [Lacipirellula sp.]|uniref:hypothetical protein n=1 Tax=Lacipirellula sp. TaxID=2691419 RepID=UPI003D12739D